MAKQTLRNKPEKELKALFKEKRDLLRDFRFRITKGKAKDVKTGRRLRKEIARILTEINRRVISNS
jgi:ribosomal protein L29